MVDLHKGIRAIHNNVISINGDTEETIIATDINGDEITIDWTQVNAWTDPEQYKYDRKKEYPPMADQLDDIFHNGINSWKASIQIIKDKYPKE